MNKCIAAKYRIAMKLSAGMRAVFATSPKKIGSWVPRRRGPWNFDVSQSDMCAHKGEGQGDYK